MRNNKQEDRGHGHLARRNRETSTANRPTLKWYHTREHAHSLESSERACGPAATESTVVILSFSQLYDRVRPRAISFWTLRTSFFNSHAFSTLSPYMRLAGGRRIPSESIR